MSSRFLSPLFSILPISIDDLLKPSIDRLLFSLHHFAPYFFPVSPLSLSFPSVETEAALESLFCLLFAFSASCLVLSPHKNLTNSLEVLGYSAS